MEHARIGGPGTGRVAGPGLTQSFQQRGDGPRIVQAGQQGGGRVDGSDLAQRPQQRADGPGATEAGVMGGVYGLTRSPPRRRPRPRAAH